MKKLILASIIALSAMSSNAQVTTAIASYEANTLNGSAVNQQEVLVGANVALKNGYAVQGLGVGDYNRGGAASVTDAGWLIGGTKTFGATYDVAPTVGLGYGHLGGDNGQALNFWQVSASGSYAVANGTSVIGGYRYRQGDTLDAGFRSNRFSLGVEKQLSKTLSVGATANHTYGEGYQSNGIGANIAYTF